LTPVAESVISIHEAFHVPLFYFRTSIDDVARDIDYIAFVGSFGVDGFWGLRQNAFHPYQDTVFTDPMNEGCIPELGDVREHYRKLLLDSKIVFAADARHVLKKRGKLL